MGPSAREGRRSGAARARHRRTMSVRPFFESRYRRYGDVPKALDWSERGQRLRFEVLASIGPLEGASLLDVGCGLGHLYEFLRPTVRALDYSGVDLSPRFVEACRRKFSAASFEVRDVLRSGLDGSYDYVLSSGLHNLETGRNEREMRSLLQEAWSASRRGVGVNMLSRWASTRPTGRHFYDPATILRFARTLTPRVSLRHDYLPHDFTIFLYREAPP
ncbi:MAG: class I SAM-dependent methyltransferase [Methanobacteriota archaeon]